jgi:ribosome assembly protein 1
MRPCWKNSEFRHRNLDLPPLIESNFHSNPAKVEKIVTALNLRINPRELKSKDTKNLLTVIFQQWLPLSTCAFQAVVDIIPSPLTAQPIRLPRMLHPTVYTSPSAGAIKPNTKLEEDLYACRQGDNDNVVAYVSKMFAIPKADLPEKRRKEVTAAEMRERGRIEREKRAAAAAAAAENGDQEEAAFVPLDSAVLNGQPDTLAPEEQAADEAEDNVGEALIGFARIYSGTIKRGSKVHCILPKYDAALPPDHPRNARYIQTATITNLYMMMGRELMPVEIVPAGNIFAIGGLEGKVLRNATICAPGSAGISEATNADDQSFVNLAGVAMQSAPIVRVALEPTEPGEWSKHLLLVVYLYRAPNLLCP